MTDIEERLERARAFFKQCEDDTLEHLVGDAGTEIKRLREELNFCTGVCGDKWKEIFRLRAALQKIDDIVRCTGVPYAMEYSPDKRFFHVRNITREALGDG